MVNTKTNSIKIMIINVNGHQTFRYPMTPLILKAYGLESPTNKRFKETFRNLKNASGARLNDIADSIMMSHGYVSDLLNGKSRPPFYMMERIAFFFGLPPTHFLEYRIGMLIKRLKKYPVMIDVFWDILNSGYNKKNGEDGN